MRLSSGQARYVAEIHNQTDMIEALQWAKTQQVPSLMIGGGSNIVWRDEDFPGLLLVNKILGYEVVHEDETSATITIGGGEPWDSVVERSVQAGLSGIEALSLIPGTAGATPIQNVGAYGQEIAQTLVSVEAYDTNSDSFVTIPVGDCSFGYRTSRFKTTDRGRFYICTITLRLTKGNPLPPFYPAVASYVTEHHIEVPTPTDVREAVIAIRSAKLPDPADVPNNGSFFANPIISEAQLAELQASIDPNIPHWPDSGGGEKVPAAWLIERAGLKDYHDPETGMATWANQPLVIINEHARSTADLLSFKQKIVDTVATKFGITLVQEPELLP